MIRSTLSRLWAAYWRAVRSPPDLEVSDQLREFVSAVDGLSSLRANARPPDKAPARVIDFTAGENRWGHAFHGDTWKVAPSRFEGLLWWRKEITRVTVLAHCRDAAPGDYLLFTNTAGRTRRTLVAVAENVGNPPDMWKLTLEDAPEDVAPVSPSIGEVQRSETTEPNTTFTRRSSRGEGREAGRKDGETT